LRGACAALLNATHPRLRELPLAYQQRAVQLGDERDVARPAELA
ncbi:sel1 repeat family protein, partial [Pseudomonas sp. MWU13-2860]